MRIIILISGLLSLVLASCGGVSEVVKTGGNTFMVASSDTTIGAGGGNLKVKLNKAAGKYCAEQNKVLTPVSSSSVDWAIGRPASAELTFRCLLEGGSELQPLNPDIKALPKMEVIQLKVMGYSHNTTVKNIKLDSQWAMLDAKIKAIEKAGVKIESTTVVNNYEFLSDVVESKAKGVLLPGFEFVEFGYDENGVYKVLLIGSVQGIK